MMRPLPVMTMTEAVKRPTITLRLALSGDEAFLYNLYCLTRAEEIGAWGLEAAQQETLFKLQFTAQRRHYEIAFPGAEHKIIICDDHPAGRILVFRSEHELRLVDIALLPEHRGAGIGGSLIRGFIAEAKAAGNPLVLHVEKQNRAIRLYERLGLTITGDTGGHYRMEWRPDETIDQPERER
jgi:ribosomal protein S18 acetylase RimI-like enzyme